MKNSAWENLNSAWLDMEPLGLTLDYSRIGLSQEFLKQHSTSIPKALASMKRLEAGEIANPDENRSVGHYWLRNPELSPSKEIRDEITTAKQRTIEFAKEVIS